MPFEKTVKPYNFFCFSVLGAMVIVILTGCATDRKLKREVGGLFKNSTILNTHHLGFALSDLENGKSLFEKDADKYFVPASNAKLLTFYAGLKMLSDSIPALRYIEKGDSLIFWGTGDPSFLQSRLKGVKALNFLRSSNRLLFFSAGRYTGDFYGTGWAWDDYNDYYQAEITELPIMDNLISVSTERGALRVKPLHFMNSLVKDSLESKGSFKIAREVGSNKLRYPGGQAPPSDFDQQVPYKTSTELTLTLLADTLKRNVGLVQMEMPEMAKTVYSVPTEDVLREMMLPSDNFIAEQLLLVYANQFQSGLNGADAIKHIEKTYLADLPDKPRWVDGSGLSRMNLITPRDFVALLILTDRHLHNREKLFSLLPAGGKTGTLKNAYPKTEQPYVYGKTGSLSGVYNQSGYLLTKKGRVFCFSFLNNNFVTPVAGLREEMAKLITYIHEKY